MATVIRRETRKRGFFGWVFLLVFFAFNAFMAFWLISYWGSVSDLSVGSEAAKAGRAIGGTIGSGVIVFFWVAGAVILGIFTLLTRGKKTIIEETQS